LQKKEITDGYVKAREEVQEFIHILENKKTDNRIAAGITTDELAMWFGNILSVITVKNKILLGGNEYDVNQFCGMTLDKLSYLFKTSSELKDIDDDIMRCEEAVDVIDERELRELVERRKKKRNSTLASLEKGDSSRKRRKS